MKNIALIILGLFLSGCASNNMTAYGQKKDPFLPTLARDCVTDKNVSYDAFSGMGYVCAHDNGIIFVKPALSKFKISKNNMQKRAESFCSLYDKKSKYAGKANIATFGAFNGEEYLCIN